MIRVVGISDRLYLRELRADDLYSLATILCDEESMRRYPAPFSKEKVKSWIDRNIESYGQNGHGLWAVILKEDDCFIGDCGITLQEIEGELLPELGYHIHKDHWNKGYATEAASLCISYAFDTLNLKKIYTYTAKDNGPSIRVAEKNGMQFIKSFQKTVMGSVEDEVLYELLSPKETVLAYWDRMNSNDFSKAAEFFSDNYICIWPQSSELIRGKENFIAINSYYPAQGRWVFSVNSVIAEGDRVVSDVSISDGDVKARAITFHQIKKSKIIKQTEFWPEDYDAPGWRQQWVESFDNSEPLR